MTEDFKFTEDDLLPLSTIQHLLFCERQAALILVERVWADNSLTLEGSRLHRRVDEKGPRLELRGDLAITRSLALRSFDLGLSGRADVVEFHRREPSSASTTPGYIAEAVAIHGLPGFWRPCPVDYKRGRPKHDRSDEVQLCAQAICLEEMLRVRVPEGFLFYGKTQRRFPVVFNDGLRNLTRIASVRLHEISRSGRTPSAEKTQKCGRCSFLEACMPEAMSRGRSPEAFLKLIIEEGSQSTEVDR